VKIVKKKLKEDEICYDSIGGGPYCEECYSIFTKRINNIKMENCDII